MGVYFRQDNPWRVSPLNRPRARVQSKIARLFIKPGFEADERLAVLTLGDYVTVFGS